MPHTLPYHCQCAGNHEHEKETLKYDREVLQVVAVHVDACQCADHAAGCYEAHPVPLPPAPDHSESLVFSQISFPMLPQVYQCEHDANAE